MRLRKDPRCRPESLAAGSPRKAATLAAPITGNRVLELQAEFGNQAVLSLLPQPASTPAVGVVQRSALDDNTEAADRGLLEVLTLEHVGSLTADEIKQRMEDSVQPRPPADQVQFGSEVPDKIKRGLTHLAVEFAGGALRANSVVNVPLNLASFGGVNGVYRFVRVERRAKPRRLLLIDQVSGTPPADPAMVDVTNENKRFAQFGFNLGSGFAAADDRKQLLAALARVPDAILSHAKGVTFQRRLQPVGANNEPGHYDPNTHTIVLFGAAKQTFMSSADAGGADWFTYALTHELGHVVDSEPLVRARDKRDGIALELAAAQRRLRQIDPNAGLDTEGADEKKKAEVARLTKELRKAEEQLDKVRPDSLSAENRKFDKAKGAAISTYGGTDPQDDFAEMFAIFTLDPELLKSLRPDKFKYFAETFK